MAPTLLYLGLMLAAVALAAVMDRLADRVGQQRALESAAPPVDRDDDAPAHEHEVEVLVLARAAEDGPRPDLARHAPLVQHRAA